MNRGTNRTVEASPSDLRFILDGHFLILEVIQGEEVRQLQVGNHLVPRLFSRMKIPSSMTRLLSKSTIACICNEILMSVEGTCTLTANSRHVAEIVFDPPTLPHSDGT